MIYNSAIQVPEWARANHPILRHRLSHKKHVCCQRPRYLYLLDAVVLGLLTVGFVYVTDWLNSPAGTNATDIIWRIVYFPLLLIQFGLHIYTISSTIYSVDTERRNLRWDTVCVTELGAELTIRTWWLAVFYRMRGWLGIILLVRIILIIGIFYDLTAFRGHYLQILTVNVSPEISTLASVLLLGLLITAGVFLPLTTLGLDAATGLLISVTVKQRIFVGLIHGIIVTVRLVAAVGLLLGITHFLQGKLEVIDTVAWFMLLIFAVVGDCGLLFLQLGVLGQIWASVPYAMFFGLALLVFTLIQTFITEQLLVRVVKNAETTG